MGILSNMLRNSIFIVILSLLVIKCQNGEITNKLHLLLSHSGTEDAAACIDQNLEINCIDSKSEDGQTKYNEYKIFQDNREILTQVTSDRQNFTVNYFVPIDAPGKTNVFKCENRPRYGTGIQYESNTYAVRYYHCLTDKLRIYKKFAGRNVTLNCIGVPRGISPIWTLDGHHLPQSLSTNAGYSMTIRNLSVNDVGVYRCAAPIPETWTYYVAPFDVSILTKLGISNRLSPYNLSNNYRVTIHWAKISEKSSQSGIEHRSEFEEINRNKTHYVELTSCSNSEIKSDHGIGSNDLLQLNSIMNFSLLHSAQELTTTNRLGSEISGHLILSKVTGGKIPDDNDMNSVSQVVGHLGESVTLKCGINLTEISGAVRRVKWSRQPLPSIEKSAVDHDQRIDQISGEYTIDIFLREDEGTYFCEVTFCCTAFNDMAGEMISDLIRYMHSAQLSIFLAKSVTFAKPIEVFCSDTGPTSILFTWSKQPNETGRSIDYKIRYRHRINDHIRRKQIIVYDVIGSQGSASLDELEQETVYAVEIVAFNKNGESEPAEKLCSTGTSWDSQRK